MLRRRVGRAGYAWDTGLRLLDVRAALGLRTLAQQEEYHRKRGTEADKPTNGRENKRQPLRGARVLPATGRHIGVCQVGQRRICI